MGTARILTNCGNPALYWTTVGLDAMRSEPGGVSVVQGPAPSVKDARFQDVTLRATRASLLVLLLFVASVYIMALNSNPQSDSACEECRRRKSKCDRARPICGSCVRFNATCVFIDERPKRGPKKGQLRALKAKVALLERKLAERSHVDLNAPNMQEDGTSSEVDDSDQPIQTNQDARFETVNWLDDLAASWEHGSIGILDMSTTSSGFPDSTWAAETLHLSDMVQADLVYPFAPIIHRRRYFSWANQESPSPAHKSLRLAIWTLAAAVSAQFLSLSDQLHAATLRALRKVNSSERNIPWMTGNVQLEEAQAWLLLAHYEFIRMERHHVLLTAAHAFRLVQLARLHVIDAIGAEKDGPLDSDHDANAVLEEKRRTFWLAFCFDRLLNARDNLTFTIQEEVASHLVVYTDGIHTEDDFQASQSRKTTLLTEAMTALDRRITTLTSFAENTVLTALYGRCLTHRRLAMLVLSGSNVSEKNSDEFCSRHNWLETALEKLILPLSDMPLDPWDPMTTFGHMLGRSAIIHLGETAAAWTWQTAEHRLMASNLEERGYRAATELAHLTTRLPRASYLKASPNRQRGASGRS
ncbi:hypothetical protein F66182_7729 [Fusarium sp. NRRL 66182]|nr:hypothetical protein F66182_7729 [Fusarium sp. NRRL 66182]